MPGFEKNRSFNATMVELGAKRIANNISEI